MPLNRRTALVLATVLAVALAFVATVSGFDAFTGRQIRDVAVPPVDATPEQVVTAYTEALDARDCETATALRTPDSIDVALSWCEEVGSLDGVEIRDHSVEDPAHSGHSPDTQVVSVGATFHLRWRPFRSDASVPEGPMMWDYVLVRAGDDHPWRIGDEGVA